MKEYQISETFSIGKDTYKVVEESGCELCDFRDYDVCNYHLCYDGARMDSTPVAFILFDSEEPDGFDLTGGFSD